MKKHEASTENRQGGGIVHDLEKLGQKAMDKVTIVLLPEVEMK